MDSQVTKEDEKTELIKYLQEAKLKCWPVDVHDLMQKCNFLDEREVSDIVNNVFKELWEW